MSDITITLCNPSTGQSESMPVAPTLTINELLEWSRALLGMEGTLILVKDGTPLSTPSQTLSQAGISNGDLLVVMKPRALAPAPAPSRGGGLDFSNLLGGSSSGGAAAATNDNPTPIYYEGMSLADAVMSNPHPKAIVKVLQEHNHLFKELNYHNPILASKLQNQPYEQAVKIWREDRVKGSISSAAAISQAMHKERDFTRRLQQNPNGS